MRVILLEDIKDLGKKYDIKEIKDGFARNSLLPKGLVRIADAKAMKWLEEQKEVEAKKAEVELKNCQEVASNIDGLEVLIPIKVGEKGQLFEKVTNQKISEKLKELGFDIKKEKIDLAEPITEIGEFPIKIKFEHNLEAEIQVVVTEEK